MPIIKNKQVSAKEKISVTINSATLKQINAYCEWAGIYDLGYFIEEIANYIFTKDKSWKKLQKK